ncbi:uncharacterized protein LOC112349802 isoform X1 [Selaginella moellendorffii]|uniref:uncharacterized protein LOC112349802 isoform X1 n=1 Tax=Selaginella moellendorffii TaxID=88036 RepID=UPI000D1C8785|nr:uncharacterized protein LOC112349802 isoform X1 [Selaginella moellendorffii]|eukprot:XP_024540658.1 uncharacterized protein LOC112349802 isoform X1 [Selaginella moellendorffii]
MEKQALWRPGFCAPARSSRMSARAMQGESSVRSIPSPQKPIRAEIKVPVPPVGKNSSAGEEKEDFEEKAPIPAPVEDISVDYYEPKLGDVVVGMVVSGNSSKLEVDIGAQSLGMMFARDLVPFERFKLEDRMWRIDDDNSDGYSERFVPPTSGRACLVKDDEALDASAGGDLMVEPGTIVQLLIIGKTLSGTALLSMRNFSRPIAWQRVRDIHSAEESIEVRIESYNLGGLICRIEGLTAFLPKDMIQNSPRDITQLKDYVGRTLLVMIIEVEEAKARILVNERAAWVQQLAPPDSLVEGVVKKVEAYGVVVSIDETDLSALLHISNISHRRIARVADIFAEGDRIKAVVLRPRVPDKVILSTSLLEREKGSIIADKEKVFTEADDAFKDWRRDKSKFLDDVRRSKTGSYEETLKQARDVETKQIANLDWLDFEENK